MTIYQIKPGFQDLLRPVSDALWSRGVTANQVTVGAAVLSLGTGAAITWFAPDHRVLLLLPPVLLLRMVLNAIDGMIAKEHGLVSRLGGILNELGDVISDAALYLPIAMDFGFDPMLVAIIVALAVISEMAGVLGKQRRYDGPMGKSDRAFVFGVASLALGLGVPQGHWQNVLLAAVAVLLSVTIWNRGKRA